MRSLVHRFPCSFFLDCLGFYSWPHQAVAMRFLRTLGFAASLCFLPSLVKAGANDTVHLPVLLGAPCNLGYDDKKPPHLTH